MNYGYAILYSRNALKYHIMRRAFLAAAILLSSAFCFAQEQTFDFDQMRSFNQSGVEKTTRFLKFKGWSITSEGEDTEPLRLEYRIFKKDGSLIKITWMRHLENVLESFIFLDASRDLDFNLKARAWIRDTDLILRKKDTSDVPSRPGFYQVIEHYSKKTARGGMVFLDMGRTFLPEGALMGYRYEFTEMPGLNLER